MRRNFLFVPLPWFGKMPISRWAIPVFSGICLVALVAYLFNTLWRDPEATLISAKEANRRLEQEISEYGTHLAETPAQILVDSASALRVHVYEDSCVLLQKRALGRVYTRLVLDLAANPERLAHAAPFVLPSILPVVEARGGQCWNPHPGDFRTWYGKKGGCWVEVWREWPDGGNGQPGCLHMQLFNFCASVFDTNQDGTPKVTWIRCVH